MTFSLSRIAGATCHFVLVFLACTLLCRAFAFLLFFFNSASVDIWFLCCLLVPRGGGCYAVRYAGDLREGVRHGKGIFKFRNGAEYDGQWIRGRMDGYGSYLWPDAKIYKGTWESGLRHGEGTLSFPSGER